MLDGLPCVSPGDGATCEVEAGAVNKLSLMTGASIVALAMLGSAAAQELDVTKRPRPEFDPQGLRAGSFLIYPKTELHETYNSNIYAVQTNETDDFITRINPTIEARSDWNNHALNARAFVDHAFYADNSDEDWTDYGAGFDGRIDVTRAANIFGGAGARHLHEDRGSPDDTLGVEPTEFDRYDANLGATYKPNRLGITVEGTWRQLDYDNVNTSTGAVVNNQDRDRNIYGQRLRVGYEIQPGYTAFVQGSLNQREYKTTPDDNGFNRDSDGWRLNGGVEFRITNLIDGEVYAGYLEQNYDDPALQSESNIDFGGRLLWAPTQLTSVRATLAREVVETTSAGASGYLATIVSVAVDHELMRNVLIGANASYTNNDYDGITREDNVWRLGVNGKYLITRHFFAGARAGWTDRDSDAAGQSYDQYTVGAFIGAQF